MDSETLIKGVISKYFRQLMVCFYGNNHVTNYTFFSSFFFYLFLDDNAENSDMDIKSFQCFLGCKTLTVYDYVQLIWTSMAELPGRIRWRVNDWLIMYDGLCVRVCVFILYTATVFQLYHGGYMIMR